MDSYKEFTDHEKNKTAEIANENRELTIENICYELSTISKKIHECDNENQIYDMTCRMLSLLEMIPHDEDDSCTSDKTLSNVKTLLSKEFIDSIIKAIFCISTAHRISESLYCLSRALYFSESASQYFNETSKFERLLEFFNETETFTDFNEQSRVIIPIADIMKKCCNSKEDALAILESRIFDKIIDFLTESIKENAEEDADPDIVSFTDATEDELLKCVNTFLYYYEVFQPETVGYLINLASASIKNKHKHSFKTACDITLRLYCRDPNMFPLIINGDECIFDLMLDLFNCEAEEEHPTGLDISPIIFTLKEVLNKSGKIAIVNDKQEDEEDKKEIDDAWKNHYEYAHALSKKIDPDAVFYYVMARKSIMEESNCDEANEALLLLAKKMELDEEVSTDIEVSDIYKLLSVAIEDGGIKMKEAFTIFFFTYLNYAPDFILRDILSSTSVIDFLSSISGSDLKPIKVIIDFFYRITEVLGRNFMEDEENYCQLFDSTIPEFIEDSERVYPELNWKIDLIMSHYEEDDGD